MVDLQQVQRESELLRAEVAQLKQTNNELQETIHRSRIFSDLISNYTYAFRVESDGQLVPEFISDRFIDLTGFTAEESESRGGWAVLCHPEDLGIAQARAQRLFAGEDDVSEFRIITKNGTVRWLRDYGHPEWDASEHRVARIYGAAQDITEHKQLMTELQETELKFRTIADYTNDWEIWESPTGTLRYMSPACLGITGYTAQEFFNDPNLMLAIIVQDDRQIYKEHRRHKHATMEPMTLQYRIWHREGAVKWIEHLCQPVWDAEHHYLGRRISNRDISQRKAVTEALREREATLQALYQALPIPTYTWIRIGYDFVLKDFNKAAENMTYGKIADLLGSKASAFYHDQPEILENFARCYVGQRNIELEWHGTSKSTGKHSDLAIRFAYAPPDFVLIHTEDITECVEADLESQRYIDTLQALRSIVRGILQTQSTREIAQSAADQLCQLINCECVGVLHFDASLNKAVVLAVAGSENYTDAHAGTLLISEVCGGITELKKGMIARIAVQPHDPRSGCVFGAKTRELLGFPLMIRERLIGCLKLEFAQRNALPAHWEAFVSQVSDELAMVIQQANLREELQHDIQNMESRIADRTRELSTLYAIADIAGQTFDQQEMVERTLDRALKAMRCNLGGIHLLNTAGGASDILRLAASQGVPKEIMDMIKLIPADTEMIDRMLQNVEPLVLDVFHSQLPESLQAFTTHWERYLGVPIHTNTGPVGIVSVIRTKKQPQFTVEEIALLTSISAQIGRAVESEGLRIQAENAAVMEERARLGRELHDSVTQLLYSLTLFAEMASDANATGESGACQRSLERIGDIAYQVVKEMRLLLYELLPSTLVQDGLVKALDRRLDSVERRAGIDVKFEVEPCPFLTPSVELELYRIAQEALNNILLHAEAGHIDVRLKCKERIIVLEIEDNGAGFSTESAALHGGLGIKNMHERAERLGSRLDIQSIPGQGTRVQISVEVPNG